jgi:hypothetical protein
MGSLHYVKNLNQRNTSYTLKSDSLTLEKPRYYIYTEGDKEFFAWPLFFYCNTCDTPWCFTLPVDGKTGEKSGSEAIKCPRCGDFVDEFCDMIHDRQ